MITAEELDRPEECCMCGCPEFRIERQWKIRGFIMAVWRCTFCDARNSSRTENRFMAMKTTPEPRNGR